MIMRHTQGRWETIPNMVTPTATTYIYLKGTSQVIATVCTGTDAGSANARLIASAPDLLACLAEIVGSAMCGHAMIPDGILRRARRHIRRATAPAKKGGKEVKP